MAAEQGVDRIFRVAFFYVSCRNFFLWLEERREASAVALIYFAEDDRTKCL